MDDRAPEEVVNTYRRRWWIETLFHDEKNRDCGRGPAHVQLKEYERCERLFYVVALTFVLLSAHGAIAEAQDFGKGLKANTRKTRVLNLL